MKTCREKLGRMLVLLVVCVVSVSAAVHAGEAAGEGEVRLTLPDGTVATMDVETYGKLYASAPQTAVQAAAPVMEDVTGQAQAREEAVTQTPEEVEAEAVEEAQEQKWSDVDTNELYAKAEAGDGFVEALTRDAEAEDMQQQYILGLLFNHGRGVSQDYSKAFEWYSKAAEQGHAVAQNNLAILYLNGTGVGQDDAQMVYWLTKAAEQGYAMAQSNLGECYGSGRGVSQDYSKAFEWISKAAEQGNAVAQHVLGALYGRGQGGASQDFSKSFEWVSKAAAQGYPMAQADLGYFYKEGRGVPRDSSKAAEWYSKAAEQGHAMAQNNLGQLYNEGDGVPQDYAQGVYWLTMAANQGQMEAQRYLGLMYRDGIGVSRDPSQSDYWYKLADANPANNKPAPAAPAPRTASAASRTAASPVSLAAPVPEAMSAYGFQLIQYGRGGAYEARARQAGAEEAASQTSLGTDYEHGVNVAQDYAYAAYWYTLAAEHGDREAQRYLGSLYERGLGVDQDYAKAVYWYTKAGEQGEDDVWRHLAYMYENGAGVSKDSSKAEYWYKKIEGEAAARTAAFVASDAKRKQPGTTYTQYGDAIVTDASGTTTYYLHGYTTSDGYDLVSNHYETKSAIVVHPDGSRTYYDGFGYNMSAGDGINVRQGMMSSQDMYEMVEMLDSLTPEEILDIWAGRNTGY